MLWDRDRSRVWRPLTAIQIRELSNAIARLTPHQRAVVRLFSSGSSYDEIARIQSISRGSVNKALVKAHNLRLVHDAS